MQFGLSRVCITPDFPTCLACSQKKDILYERIHDDIFLNCMVLSNKDSTILIMSYDLLFHSRDLHKLIYDYTEKKYGIQKSNIVITFTHNHNSPSTLGYNDFSSSPEYENLLINKSIEAIKIAYSSMNPGIMKYGEISGRWAVNRRLKVDNEIKLAPNPHGPKDDIVYFLGLFDNDNNIVGMLINYACHPVHYPDTLALTGEYPGYICSYLEKRFPGCVPLFIQGAGANARPVATSEGDKFVPRPFEYIENMAFEIANEITKSIIDDKLTEQEPTFISEKFTVTIPTEDEGVEYFRKCIDDENLSAHLRRNASEMVSTYNKIKASFDLECGIISLAKNLYIIHMGGEPCCEVKFNLMPLFNQSNVIFTGYTDACAYIVPDSMILQGGYEVRCFLEYKHKGKILPGIDSLLYNAFSDAKAKLLL